MFSAGAELMISRIFMKIHKLKILFENKNVTSVYGFSNNFPAHRFHSCDSKLWYVQETFQEEQNCNSHLCIFDWNCHLQRFIKSTCTSISHLGETFWYVQTKFETSLLFYFWTRFKVPFIAFMCVRATVSVTFATLYLVSSLNPASVNRNIFIHEQCVERNSKQCTKTKAVLWRPLSLFYTRFLGKRQLFQNFLLLNLECSLGITCSS